jgi:hypothetical protein
LKSKKLKDCVEPEEKEGKVEREREERKARERGNTRIENGNAKD